MTAGVGFGCALVCGVFLIVQRIKRKPLDRFLFPVIAVESIGGAALVFMNPTRWRLFMIGFAAGCAAFIGLLSPLTIKMFRRS